MTKKHAIQATLEKMRVGESLHFPMDQGDKSLEVERIFTGKEQGWVMYQNQKRKVFNDVRDVAQIIVENWNPSLKKILRQQFSEMDEIEDMGNF